jgi:hypothetical protein
MYIKSINQPTKDSEPKAKSQKPKKEKALRNNTPTLPPNPKKTQRVAVP